MLFIQTIRHVHGVSTPEEFRALHERQLALRAQQSRDPRIKPFGALRPLVARVNDGVWLGDCDCGSGVAVEPGWGEARCFGCGAIYTNITMPAHWREVEGQLEPRPRRNQHWDPDEPIEQLRADNRRHGIVRHDDDKIEVK
jgi:hypothetical protein